MSLQWFVAFVHLLALGLGLGAVWFRGLTLLGQLGQLDERGIRRVLHADTLWGIAALLWVASGLVRVFAGTDKVSAYYFDNWLFWTKMTLFVVLLLHEIRPMLTLIRWRRVLGAGRSPDISQARRLARISFIEAGIVVVMVALATGMARGHGMLGGG